jgi:hypothetical protein
MNRRLGGPQSKSGGFGQHKNILPLPGSELHIIQFTLHLQRYISEAINISSTLSSLQKQTAWAFTIALSTGSSAV